jgi:FtsH-binding integral membrane protein
MYYSASESAKPVDAGLRAYMLSIYNLMASALALTGLTAYAGATWQPLRDALFNLSGIHPGLTGLGWVVAFAPLLFVIGLSAGISRMSLAAAQATFWAFSAIMGLSLSSLFFVYTGESLVRVFFITAILFGSMSIWGYSTKRDLTGMGHFMMMGLWGVLIASVVNIFLHSSGLQFAVSIVGIVVFTGLTAYDTQKIKAMYYQVAGMGEMASKYAIMGALNLYLDFINMFLMLLRFFGDRRN